MATKPPGKEKFKAPLKGTPKHTSPPFLSRVIFGNGTSGSGHFGWRIFVLPFPGTTNAPAH
jgi:hypothetical protein